MSTVASIVAWVHIGAVVIVIGGSAFNLFILRPTALKVLEPAVAGKLLGAVAQRFRSVLWASIATLVVTGLYTATVVRGVNTLDDLTSTSFGRTLAVKSLLASVLFSIGLLLTLPLKATAKLRGRMPVVLTLFRINLGIAALIILLAALLMRRGGIF